MIQLSLIICTHNPRLDRLDRTLEAVKVQTLPKERWELLVVDNASTEKLADCIDLSWHPFSKVIREDKLGLTPARLCGIGESTGDIIVFVDDDNLLAPNYLEIADNLFTENPSLGVMGGRIIGEYETPPSYWANPFLPFLAIVEHGDRPLQTLLPGITVCAPPGAGMIIRSDIARHYAKEVIGSPLRLSLDRCGAGLMGCGDNDMAMCAFELGYALSYQPSLRLTHIIPAFRLDKNYLRKLVEESIFSSELLLLSRGYKSLQDPIPAWFDVVLRVRAFVDSKRNLTGHQEIKRCIQRGARRAHAFFRRMSGQTQSKACVSNGRHPAEAR